jgi:hypothetical protein
MDKRCKENMGVMGKEGHKTGHAGEWEDNTYHCNDNFTR